MACVSGIGIEELHRVRKRGADDRVAADADAGGLADAQLAELADRFVRQRARAGNHAHIALLVNVRRHDADLAFARRNDARAVGTDQARGPALQELSGANHVGGWNAFRDANHERDAGIGGLHDGVGGIRRRDEDDGCIRARPLDGFRDGVEHRAVQMQSGRLCRALRPRLPGYRNRWMPARGSWLPGP